MPIGSVTAVYHCLLGPLEVSATPDGTLTRVVLPIDREPQPGDDRTASPPTALAAAWAAFDAYFAGDLKEWDLALAPEGTAFQQSVWAGLRDIRYGATWSYGQLAEHIGMPGAARAVGAANRENPLPIVIPCHRVIGANGALTGYGGPNGLALKRMLLDLEAGMRSWC